VQYDHFGPSPLECPQGEGVFRFYCPGSPIIGEELIKSKYARWATSGVYGTDWVYLGADHMPRNPNSHNQEIIAVGLRIKDEVREIRDQELIRVLGDKSAGGRRSLDEVHRVSRYPEDDFWVGESCGSLRLNDGIAMVCPVVKMYDRQLDQLHGVVHINSHLLVGSETDWPIRFEFLTPRHVYPGPHPSKWDFFVPVVFYN
jgi:hypothetical protein